MIHRGLYAAGKVEAEGTAVDVLDSSEWELPVGLGDQEVNDAEGRGDQEAQVDQRMQDRSRKSYKALVDRRAWRCMGVLGLEDWESLVHHALCKDRKAPDVQSAKGFQSPNHTVGTQGVADHVVGMVVHGETHTDSYPTHCPWGQNNV